MGTYITNHNINFFYFKKVFGQLREMFNTNEIQHENEYLRLFLSNQSTGSSNCLYPVGLKRILTVSGIARNFSLWGRRTPDKTLN